ncbi:IclR family transcriptional regulator C-terminal domain-containing protein [Saccharopolyspora shandongensis]|uniref:IclR family transcriptional regulator n=1 Tax=Saccharopolyspora shandongensis TaxID=418495 RepID=UPI0033CC0FCD
MREQPCQASDRAETQGGFTRSVDRALSLLEALAAHGSPSSLSGLARATSLSKATVHRILNTLVARGFAERAGDGYTLGNQMFQPRPEAIRAAALQRKLMPFLLSLYERTHSAVSVGVLHRGYVFYSDRLHHQWHNDSFRQPVPAHCSAVGKLFLSYEHDVIAGLAERELKRFTAMTITRVGDLSCELTIVRRKSVAYSHGEYLRDEAEVAVPIFGADRRIVAGMSVAGPVNSMNLDAVRMEASQSAQKASHYLSQPTALGLSQRCDSQYDGAMLETCGQLEGGVPSQRASSGAAAMRARSN